MCAFFFSSINQETEFCIQNVEKTNRCQRLSYKLIKTNSERNLTICKKIIDGKWTEWRDIVDCEGIQEVEGVPDYRCGLGYKQQEKSCVRTLGGTFCQLDGDDYKGTILRNSVKCHSGDCPG